METDLSTALGRLLCDSALREAFARNPAAVAALLEVRPVDYEVFTFLSPVEIEDQARALLKKRFHEVRKLAPITCGQLGPRASSSFDAYAQTHWPEGHCRHLRDALAFYERAAGRCQSELNRLRFSLGRRRFVVHAVADLPVNSRPQRALQILTRSRGGVINERAIFLRL